MSGKFQNHFKEAIIVNKERKKFYSNQTKGKSKKLSNILLFFSYFLLPITIFIDKKALKFNKLGIPIIENDFVSLENIKPKTSPPLYQSELKLSDLKIFLKSLKKFKNQINYEIKKNNFIEICRLISKIILNINEFENEKKIHLALYKHIYESIGFAAHNAIEYSKFNNNDALKLSKKLIKIQLLGLILSPYIDKIANKLHQTGCGILVNDIPDIPFPVKLYSEQ